MLADGDNSDWCNGKGAMIAMPSPPSFVSAPGQDQSFDLNDRLVLAG